jgi:uncharacterized membrane protein
MQFVRTPICYVNRSFLATAVSGTGVPHVSITIASALSLTCLFALLFHVNKLARSIISDTMVCEVADGLDEQIVSLAPDGSGRINDRTLEAPSSYRRWVEQTKSGYVQLIDYPVLCKLAAKEDLFLRVHIRPGQFALERREYVCVHAASPVADKIVQHIHDAIKVGPDRTPTQDLEYSVRQLVEIAVRALSPGVNDPFTAVAVINRLAAALASTSMRSLAASEYRDESGTLRLVADVIDYADLVDAAFQQIRQSAQSNVAVLVELGGRLTDLLLTIGGSRSEPIVRQLRILERLIPTLNEPEDQRALASVIGPALGLRGGRVTPDRASD